HTPANAQLSAQTRLTGSAHLFSLAVVRGKNRRWRACQRRVNSPLRAPAICNIPPGRMWPRWTNEVTRQLLRGKHEASTDQGRLSEEDQVSAMTSLSSPAVEAFLSVLSEEYRQRVQKKPPEILDAMAQQWQEDFGAGPDVLNPEALTRSQNVVASKMAQRLVDSEDE
ncbi:hypothetical protein ACKI1Q_42660, partial [Streptomyces galilaeus]|uniref:hypothetical protein n=1 Tax=Streptomyces galilaeus TaxID=33899 RepID=UPI0038F73D04